MNVVVTDHFSQYGDHISGILKSFGKGGTLIGNGSRNVVKVFGINGKNFNFKSFKQHNIINRHIYKFYRKSKARRSFEYAQMLLDKKFHTPRPVAYVEYHDFVGLTSSFYISEQLEDVNTLWDVFYNPAFEDREEILRLYTRLMFQLHENGIEFIDNSPGNFLVRKENGSYVLYMVDLNRMKFHSLMSPETRLRNFERITDSPEIISVISENYASLSGLSSSYCFHKIMGYAKSKKTRLKIKKVLKFYKFFLPLKR